MRVALRLHPPQKILARHSLSSGTSQENLAHVEPESFVKIFHSGKSQLNSSALVEENGGENS